MKPFLPLILAAIIGALTVYASVRLHRTAVALDHARTTTLLDRMIPESHAVTITKESTDERGLTSIQFTQDGKEWGLDYLTKRELDSIKAIK